MSVTRILPLRLVGDVERYIESQLADAEKYDNRHPLDESGIWSLHALAAEIYSAGWADGEATEAERQRSQRNREKALVRTSVLSRVKEDTE